VLKNLPLRDTIAYKRGISYPDADFSGRSVLTGPGFTLKCPLNKKNKKGLHHSTNLTDSF
jgi:hypothetical protein